MLPKILVIIFLIIHVSCANNKAIIQNQEATETQTEEGRPKTLEESQCKAKYSALTFTQKNKIIFENRADNIIFPASLTKLMTAYLVFESIEQKKITLEQEISISPKAAEISNINKVTTLKFEVGDKISVEDALKGMIVKSFNGAAVSLAEEISGSEWKFVEAMNAKTKELGMDFTNFRNASGLHEFGQFTTNHDLAKLTKAIINDFPKYYYIFSIKNITVDSKEFISHNLILLENDNVEGMKTGFTSMSGYNLISTAMVGDKRVVSILTSCESKQKRDEFMLYLLELNKGTSEKPKIAK